MYDNDYPTRPIGGGNPYHRCALCGVSAPQINGRVEGHLLDCLYRRIKEAALAGDRDALLELREEADPEDEDVPGGYELRAIVDRALGGSP